MFYDNNPGDGLRFGDIVQGFSLFTPAIAAPFTTIQCKYDVNIEVPEYCVVLTPCCSIKDKAITLSPLIEIKPAMIENEYFVSDLTNINRVVSSQDAVTEEVENNPEFAQVKELMVKPVYAFWEAFIYENHEQLQLPGYVVKYRGGKELTTQNYMIDFRNTYRILCNTITRTNRILPGAKVMELSISTREELRLKMANFYGRSPIEDAS